MRPRKKNKHLPPCVYQKHGAYYYVKNNKWTRLGSNLHDALIAYARHVALPTEGVPSLIEKAMPFILEKVSESTQKQYLYCERILKEMFAEFSPDQVTHGTVVRMMDMWRHSPSTANRLLTVLKQVFQWALDREIVDRNPCESVRRISQEPRDRLISPEEYRRIYKEAAPWLQVTMDLCYLTGQRIGDILLIKHEDLQPEGIYFEQKKTGHKLTVAWTEDLKNVVQRAIKIAEGSRESPYLLPTKKGTPRFHSNVWRVFKDACRRAQVDDVTLHDLRAMSGTYAEKQGLDPSALLGHTDKKTTRIYLRDKSVKVVLGPEKAIDQK